MHVSRSDGISGGLGKVPIYMPAVRQMENYGIDRRPKVVYQAIKSDEQRRFICSNDADIQAGKGAENVNESAPDLSIRKPFCSN